MSVPAWRIAQEAPTYSASELSGLGAKITGGRWNSIGVAMVYASSNIALAALETLSSLGGMVLGKPPPYNRYLVRIDIPGDIWAKRIVPDALPGGWDAIPAGMTSIMTGNAWVAQGATALLAVPSVIIPDEHNILINPAHPDTARITATTLKKWLYDPRFF